MRILILNAGSTSTKVAYVDGDSATTTTVDEAFADTPPDVVAHRIVHGGDRTQSALVDDDVLDELAALSDLAPLHQPPAIRLVERSREMWPSVPNVACFDTAFHATIPEASRTYALPADLRRVVRAYGFHGLSHAWASRRIADLAPTARRVVVAHLGGGQSLCAVRDGQSVMTTMGFTPLDGLVMGTRAGTIDPGAVLWLVQHGHADLGKVLEHDSGLLGLCGTDDIREVHRRMAHGDEAAHLAFAVWRHRAVTLLGGCIAALGGLDALVFTGGIGEHDPVARAAVSGAFDWLGVTLDDPSGVEGDREISAGSASVRAFVIVAREDLQMASEARLLVG